MDQLGRAEPGDNRETGRSAPLAVALLSSASAHENSDLKESAQVQSASTGKRNAEDIGPPPGLTLQESEAKARKTMMIHSVNLQQQV
eukprot:3782476-Amphidinium_carterae.1